ncbi:neuronal acetylcholine receptor subunit beta-3-like [Haliotis cracherodii]|uniref:neuronal acetylcholine receptor subunit beta-3-like n=1 Tax=Haliotis cracherodii TaxID=6455 RepID=UPI0039EB43B6
MSQVYYIWLAVCIFKPVLCGHCSNQTCDVLDTLLGSYQKNMHPRCDTPVEIHLGLALRQVVSLAETRQILTSNVWIRLNWTDCRLAWNVTDMKGTAIVHVPFHRIWTPDVTLYDDTSFGNNIAMSERKFHKLAVTSDGMVSQKFPTVLSSICQVDATYFPFDKQDCPLQFGLWVYDDSVVVLNSDMDGDTTSYQENAEWDLTGIGAMKRPYSLNGLNYSTVTYTVSIQRRPAFFMVTFFFPCFLICSMSILGFFLPPASGEKVGLQVTLLLSLTVFQFLTLDTLPPNSKPLPLMCIYLVLIMLLASASCVLAVVVLRVHMKGEQGWKVPSLARSLLINKLGRLLRVKRPHILREHANGILDKDNQAASVRESSLPHTSEAASSTTSSTEFGAVLTSFENISKSLNHLLKHLNDEKEAHDSMEYQDWLTIAFTLDRLFLILYAALSVITFLIFLIQLST